MQYISVEIDIVAIFSTIRLLVVGTWHVINKFTYLVIEDVADGEYTTVFLILNCLTVLVVIYRWMVSLCWEPVTLKH